MRNVSQSGRAGRRRVFPSVALVLLFGAPPARAFEGVLLRDDGRPAGGAEVSIVGMAGSTRTGPEGRFRWSPDPPTPFEVLAVLPGGAYAAPVRVTETPVDGTAVTIRLRAGIEESVTVGVGSTPHIDAPPASGASIVAREELLQRHPARLADAMETIPGVSRVDEGHSAVPSIRGLARGRTLILIDGARVTAERRAGPSAAFLNPFLLEAVEVSRGFGSVAHGSDAFGGVIHARTRQATPGSGVRGRAEGALGAGLPERSAAAEVEKRLASGGLLFQGSYRRFGDYRSPAGEVENSGARDAGGRLRLDHRLGAGRTSVSWQSDFARDVGKPATDSGIVRTSYPQEDSHRVTAGFVSDPHGSWSRLSVAVFLGTHRLVTDRDRLPIDGGSGRLDRADVRARDYGVRASSTLSLSRWRLHAGLDVNGRARLRAEGLAETYAAEGRSPATRETSIRDAARHDMGVHLGVDRLLSRGVSMTAGSRLDRVVARNRGGYFGVHNATHHAPSGFLALTAVVPGDTTVTAQAGSGFRDPTLSDRFFRGVTGRGFATGNPQLSPERSLQYDVAIRRTRPVRTALYLYRYRISDLTERYRSGDDFLFRNRGTAVLKGIELEAQIDLASGVSLDLGAQGAYGRAAEDDGALADVPPESLTLGVRKTFGSRLSLFGRGRLQAADEDPGPTEISTPGHLSLDVSVHWKMQGAVGVRLLLQNALNDSHLWTSDEASRPAPGRSVLLTISTDLW
jgi:outer membrane receptor protein involved in Fe transport